jgi:hypothetical protein
MLKNYARRGRDLDVPLSYCVKGIKESTANPVGMPMTIPEKVAFPPKYSAYLFADETMMKNDTYMGGSRLSATL